jgi:hypothetical protein
MREPDRTLVLLALSTTYIMLFNPRTETNGYVILAPVIAAFAAHIWRTPGRSVGLVALGLGCDNYPFHHQTDLWLKAALSLMFLAYVTYVVVVPARAQ